MRCIAANRSVLTALDQNGTLSDGNGNDQTAMTNDIGCMDIIPFADGWYSYPDLNPCRLFFIKTAAVDRVF